MTVVICLCDFFLPWFFFFFCFFFFSSRRRHTRCYRDWSSDVCSSDLGQLAVALVDDPGTAQQLRPADRPDSLPGIGGVDEKGGGAGLGHPHAVADAHAEIAVADRERSEERRVGKEGRGGSGAQLQSEH